VLTPFRRLLCATLATLMVLAGALTLYAQPPDTSAAALRISYQEFKRLYDARKVVLIDTRDEASFDMGHIPGAKVIPADRIGEHVAELKREKHAIVTYCS